VVVEAAPEAVVEAAPEPVVEAAPEPVTEAVVEAAPEPAAAEPVVETVAVIADDLTQIVGIGPKLAAALAERGVTSFAQLAAWGADELAEADVALNLKGRAVRDAWVAQAKRFSEA
jgi:predicted flap endonuclease-1-like 5' DNA nuclease